MSDKLSHFNESGRASMVDVGSKNVSSRTAIARSVLQISPELASLLKTGKLEKGDAFTVAKTAGILAAKQTGSMIPMCHPLPVDYVNIDIELVERLNQVRIEGTVSTTGKTGVEMEALVAVSVAGLTVYDMCKAVDKRIQITHTGLYRKTGGKSGEFFNQAMEWSHYEPR